jgi:hypothetical protein
MKLTVSGEAGTIHTTIGSVRLACLRGLVLRPHHMETMLAARAFSAPLLFHVWV